MSWDADLVLDGEAVHAANYTHNTSPMIYRAMEIIGWADSHGHGELDERGHRRPWWGLLNGMRGAEGARFLGVIVGGLMEAPALFRAMNPENGWGDYDSLLQVLAEMAEASAAWPQARWEASG